LTLGNDTRRLLDEHYADRLVPDHLDREMIAAMRSGVLTAVDEDRLVELAVRADCVLHVETAVGSFVPAGAPLVRVEGDPSLLDRDATAAALRLELERTLDKDVAYGFRLLVDVAERALSDSPFLDPTTAVQAIDRLYGPAAVGGTSHPRRSPL
jgi:uncharacterized membrane protein